MDQKMRRTVARARERARALRPTLPAGGRDAWRQLLILMTAYVSYDLIRIISRGREVVALSHSQDVIDAERALRIYWEPSLQRAILHHRMAVESFNWFYGRVHLPAILLTMALIYVYRYASWRPFRNAFLAMNFIGLTIFALLPVAPPRLVPTSGMIDTKFLFSGDTLQAGIMSFVTNPYAAMPSLHIGYALFTSTALWLLWRNRLARAIAIAYPVAVLSSIVLTANHYFLDALAGASVFALAWAVVRVVPIPTSRPLVPVPAAIDDAG